MASLGHVAVGMAAGRLYGELFADGADGKRRSGVDHAFRMVALSAASLLPDADVVAFSFGIPYAAPFGHRGASHSVVAALVVALLAGVLAWSQAAPARKRARGLRVFLFTLLVVASHGPLDALTDGGEGVALLWPFSAERFFFPWRPIPVAPIGLRYFFTASGWRVARVELLGFVPLWLLAFWPRRMRRTAA